MSKERLARAITILLVVIIGIPLLTLFSGWLWILFSSKPLEVPIATWVPWPIACTTHGCITILDWQRQKDLTVAFATATKTDLPNDNALLTTVIRHHLVQHAVITLPVTLSDAKRYREDILHILTQEQLQKTMPVSLATYDTSVIVPFLEQEAVKQERHIDTSEALYAALASQRKVFLLPLTIAWDTHKGVVTGRN